MNTDFESKLCYLIAKRKYEKQRRQAHALFEQRWEPGSGPAFKAFVKPFTDVFKALKLTAMDIGNSTRLILGTLLTFDKKKLKKKFSAYEERRGLLRGQWAPVISDSLKAIKTADPMLSFALMPHVYLGALGLATGITTGASAVDIIAGEKWERLIEKLWKMPTELDALNAINNKMDKMTSTRQKSDVMKGLTQLFFGGERQNEVVIREQQEQKKGTKYDTSSEEAWLNDFLADTGLNETFDGVVEESVANHMTILSELDASVKRALTVAKLIAADTPEKFKSTLTSAVNTKMISAGDIKELSSMLQQIETQAQQLAKSDAFRISLAKSKKSAVENLSDRDALQAANLTTFNAAKTGFDDRAINGTGSSSGLATFLADIENVQQQIKIDNELMGQLRKRADILGVKELIKIYEDIEQNYDKARQAYVTISGASRGK